MIAGVALAVVLLALQDGASAPETGVDRTLVAGAHARVTFEKSVTRVAVGDPDRLSWHVLEDRELLLLAKEPGRTTLIVWFDDGTSQETLVSVQPDLSILERALSEIHPSITVERAPDRDALVLRGSVPDLATSRVAESAARAWVEAGEAAAPLLAAGDDLIDGSRLPERPDGRRTGGVINLIRVAQLPPRMETRIERALQAIVSDGIAVTRILAGDVPDDARDVFVLEGAVRNQVQLVRALTLAATILVEDPDDLEIEAVADESGALTTVEGRALTGTSTSGGTTFTGFNLGGTGGSLFGNARQALFNLVGANVARAKIVSAADGRLLSFLRVDDLPQVRVDVRLYEVNVTELMNRENELGLLYGDFDQRSLEPAGVAAVLQGDQARRVGGDTPSDVQNVVSFLEEGFRNQLQIVGSNVAVDTVFQVLETEGVARSLARPSLTVLSGERAQFQVGGEVPVTQSFATNNVADGVFNSVEFVSFGVFLDARPLVGDDDAITLDVSPQVAFPSPQLTTLIRDTSGTNQQTTSFATRALRTTARLEDGQAMVVGGLLSQDTQWSQSETPLLADLPLIGWLFEREASSSDDFELVLVVHPAIQREPVPEAARWVFADPVEVLQHLADRSDERRDRRPTDAEPAGDDPSRQAGGPVTSEGTPASRPALASREPGR